MVSGTLLYCNLKPWRRILSNLFSIVAIISGVVLVSLAAYNYSRIPSYIHPLVRDLARYQAMESLLLGTLAIVLGMLGYNYKMLIYEDRMKVPGFLSNYVLRTDIAQIRLHAAECNLMFPVQIETKGGKTYNISKRIITNWRELIDFFEDNPKWVEVVVYGDEGQMTARTGSGHVVGYWGRNWGRCEEDERAYLPKKDLHYGKDVLYSSQPMSLRAVNYATVPLLALCGLALFLLGAGLTLGDNEPDTKWFSALMAGMGLATIIMPFYTVTRKAILYKDEICIPTRFWRTYVKAVEIRRIRLNMTRREILEDVEVHMKDGRVLKIKKQIFYLNWYHFYRALKKEARWTDLVEEFSGPINGPPESDTVHDSDPNYDTIERETDRKKAPHIYEPADQQKVPVYYEEEDKTDCILMDPKI